MQPVSTDSAPSAPAQPLCPPGAFRRSLISEAEEAAALAAIRTARQEYTAFDRYGGVEVDAYEQEFAAHVGTRFATATSSGTAAIHTALAALDLPPGSEVVCPPITDPGAVSPILFHLLIPVFADTDGRTFNVTAEAIRKVITERTRAIIVAHIAGEPCDMDAIMEVAREHGLPVIEDVAQAHDATWNGRPCGSFGTLAAFSLMSGKHHTSGGQGGMVLTSDEKLYWRAKSFADRGKTFGQPGVGDFAGLNYRMTELEAAIGRVQLRRLPGFVQHRRALAARLGQRLAGSSLFEIGSIPEKGVSVYWFLRLRVKRDDAETLKPAIAKALQEHGIPAAPTYTSIIYQQPWFAEKRVFGSSGIPWTLPQCQVVPEYEHCCPLAEKALREHLLISWNESLAEETIDRLADALAIIEKDYM
ncbi:MAG TPA: DegT/DnrJ/EryC1/StrS family aminotransferase [Chthoniobacteraceae bacterium]|nr:DegT/DnrJ/EryC1/StrS family aminotransferase [Chthoniobacteraceae bacterium]